MFHAEERFVPFEKKIWLSSPTMHGPELEYIKDAYEKNWMSTVGENINEVERLACETVGCKYAVALATGTSALHLAVKLAGVKPGEKVFCSDMTFSATVNPVVYEGGVPVFIDTEYDTWNMDPVALEKAFELYPEVRVVGLMVDGTDIFVQLFRRRSYAVHDPLHIPLDGRDGSLQIMGDVADQLLALLVVLDLFLRAFL